MATRMLQRRGTAAEWAAQNPVLGDGEIGVERDSSIFKVGDGVTPWADLPPRFAPYVHTHGDKSDVGHTHQKIVRIPHTFTITGEVKVASGDTSYIPGFAVPLLAGDTAFVVATNGRINSGTSATVSLRKNGVDISSGAVITTTPTQFAVSAAGLADGDRIDLVVTAVSGAPKNMSLTVYIEYTF